MNTDKLQVVLERRVGHDFEMLELICEEPFVEGVSERAMDLLLRYNSACIMISRALLAEMSHAYRALMSVFKGQEITSEKMEISPSLREKVLMTHTAISLKSLSQRLVFLGVRLLGDNTEHRVRILGPEGAPIIGELAFKGVEFDIEELMRCCDSHYSDLAPFLWRQDKILNFWFKTGCVQRFETYK